MMRNFVIAGLVLIIGVVYLAGAPDDAQEAYREYHQAIIAGDLETFKQYIPAAQLKDWSGDDAAQKLSALRASIPAQMEIVGSVVSGKKVRLMAKSGGATANVELLLEQDGWKVLSEKWEGAVMPPRSTPSKPAPVKKQPDKPAEPPAPPKEVPHAPASQDEFAPIKSAYLNCHKAIMEGNIEELKKYVQPEKFKELGDDPAGAVAMIQGFMPKNVVIEDVDVDGKTATLYVKGGTSSDELSGTVAMLLEDDQWKIVTESWKMGGSKDNKKRQPVVAGVPGKIAFSSNRGGQYEVYTINADGSKVKQITKKGGYKGSVAWSPDGQMIAYTSHSISEDEEVYVINADGTRFVQLTDNDSENTAPVWSADSRRIAFKSASIAERKEYEDGGVSISHNQPEIFLLNADGSGLKQLTNDAAVSDSPLSWSPDGNEIAFDSFKNGWNIYLVDVNTGNQRKLTSGHRESYPAWSPDGQMLAFTSRADFGAPTGLAVINSDGSGRKILTSAKVAMKPTRWSPDGSRLLYIAESAGPFSDDICVINADGTGMKQLTNTKQKEESASWSPDGQWICFKRDSELYIIRTDGSGEEHKISDENGTYDHVTWSPTK